MRRTAAAIVLLILASPLGAQDNEKPGERPKVTAPPPPEELTQGETIEPEVNIVRRDWAVIEEYSVRGQVYAVKVTPSVGPPYYLYDADGDGSLETRTTGGLRDVPQTHRWKILTW